MRISVINLAQSLQPDVVRDAIRAINRQIAEDFQPYWHMSADLRLDGGDGDSRPDDLSRNLAARGEAVVYLIDDAGSQNSRYLGYHEGVGHPGREKVGLASSALRR